MPKIEMNLRLQTCKYSCDMCGDNFEITNPKEFLKILNLDYYTCWKCTRYLLSVPTKTARIKEQKDLWTKLRRFQVVTTGDKILDEELRELFGDWKVNPKPLWNT